MMTRTATLMLAIFAAACGSSSSPANTPTGPSTQQPPPAQTRILAITGSLTFGQVFVGASRDLTITLANSGTATLTVRGLSITGGLANHFFTSWTSGTIGPGGSQVITITFAPESGGSFSGTITIDADHTSGTNTIPVTATALFNAAGTWRGNYVVERCDGTGSVQDLLCSTQRGVFPPGSLLPIRLSFSQNGASLAGTVEFGQVTGPVSGVIGNDGTITLQGTATSGTLTAAISTWSTRVSGNSMAGTVTYNVTVSGTPGIGVLVARLSGVSR
ncbi:MAG TPA: choice-of-anchor D domain-containing protein [Candidatus Limnocylindrales bacterium]|nr:choice-of-anchor D domain-containing protein [Candidatus Limnocylindrales bacterium]